VVLGDKNGCFTRLKRVRTCSLRGRHTYIRRLAYILTGDRHFTLLAFHTLDGQPTATTANKRQLIYSSQMTPHINRMNFEPVRFLVKLFFAFDIVHYIQRYFDAAHVVSLVQSQRCNGFRSFQTPCFVISSTKYDVVSNNHVLTCRRACRRRRPYDLWASASMDVRHDNKLRHISRNN
jgi:hypothetical protein